MNGNDSDGTERECPECGHSPTKDELKRDGASLFCPNCGYNPEEEGR